MTTMTSVIRASGTALAAGATMGAFAAAAAPFVDEKTANARLTVVGTVGIVGALLVLIGMPAWYAVQAHRAGRLGAVAFPMAFVGWAGLQVATQPFYTYAAPAIYARPGDADLAVDGALDGISTAFLAYVGVMLIALNLGLLLAGIAMLRAKVFPRVLGAVVIGGTLAVFVDPIENVAIAAVLLGVAACGVLMARGRVRFPQSVAAAAAVPAG